MIWIVPITSAAWDRTTRKGATDGMICRETINRLLQMHPSHIKIQRNSTLISLYYDYNKEVEKL